MKNKVYILSSNRLFTLEERSMITLHPEYVRVKNLYCGICGGDYSSFLGNRREYPYSLGHEFVAQIIEVGNAVTDLYPGDFIISDFNYRCGICEYCCSCQEHLCLENGIGLFSNQAFAQYSDIHYNYIFKIEELQNLYHATLIEPLSCVIHADELISQYPTPKTVLILGVGNIGMLFAFYLKSVKNIDQIFIYDTNTERTKNLVNKFHCLPYDLSFSKKFDWIIDTTNTIEGSKLGLLLARHGQSYCMMNHLYGLETSFIYESICKKEILSIFPLRNGNRNTLAQSYNLINKYWYSSYDSLLGIYPLEDIQYIFNIKSELKSNKQIMKITNL